tara:strand:- start:93 stop:632 length:540 start_codon:yes stop_codon:yes gene_type:complete
MNAEFVNEGQQIRLVGISLSSNPNATVLDDDNTKGIKGLDGKINETSDGRKYYLAIFQDLDNPFQSTRFRVIGQQFDSTGNAIWKGGDPTMIKNYVGKALPGAIVSKEVEPYEVSSADGTTRTVNTYTCVALKGENIVQLFSRAGHTLASEATSSEATVDIKLDEAAAATAEAEAGFNG